MPRLPLFLLVLCSLTKAESSLQQWLQDDVARLQLLRVLGGESHPLESVLNATNASLALPDASLARCLLDIRYVVRSASSDTRAARILDSSVKTPVGILAGAFNHLGNWDECVGVRDFVPRYPGASPFHGKMCQTRFRLGSSQKSSNIVRNDNTEIPIHVLRNNAIVSLASKLSLRLGMCVPSSCSAQHVEYVFNKITSTLPSVANMKLVTQVTDSDCSTLDRVPLDALDWVAVAILSVLALVLILSTAYDVFTPAESKRTLGAAFSIVSNGRKLLAMPGEGGDQTLSCLHGIRVLSMCWIVLGHRYLYAVQVPMMNSLSLIDFAQTWYHTIITNATVSVDTFFVMSGLLVGYLFFKQPPDARRLNLPMYYIHRYIRLTPPFALMMLLMATLQAKVGNGPLWEETMSQSRDVCRRNWWSSLLYVNNYVDPENSCGPTWYLMVEMQLHWLAPLVLLPMARWPKWTPIIVSPLIIAGFIGNFVISYVNELPGNKMTTLSREKTLFYVKTFYVPTYTRFIPYLQGLVVGYILANERFQEKKREPLDGFVKLLSWISVAALMLVPLFSGYDFLLPPLPSNFWTALYNSVHRPTWALGVLGVVYLCATDNAGIVNRFLSLPIFQMLGRLTYCVYLLHMCLQGIENGIVRTPIYIADSVILAQYAGDLVLSFLFAAVLSLACESPFLILGKELLGGLGKKKNVPKNPVEILPSKENTEIAQSRNDSEILPPQE